jgi:hypothetical protein
MKSSVKLLLLMALLLLPASLTAREVPATQQKAVAAAWSARFELVQAGPGAKWTLRLDRVTGTVDRLVPTKSNGFTWETMRVLPHPKAANSIEPHFRIFFSDSLGASLLLDTESGATWHLLVVDGGSGIWQTIE